jgi:hypothetical protein
VRSPHRRWVVLVAAIGALVLPASALAVAQITDHADGLRDSDARSIEAVRFVRAAELQAFGDSGSVYRFKK